jgi:hypothetical protein
MGSIHDFQILADTPAGNKCPDAAGMVISPDSSWLPAPK